MAPATARASRPTTPFFRLLGIRLGRLVHADGSVATTTLLRIETLVYSLERDTLLWAGTSRTSDPTNVPRLVSEIADAAAKQMVKQGVLAPSAASK